MTAIVRFSAAAGEYALPVADVAKVRRADAVQPLPEARPGIAGILRHGDDVLTILATLGEGGEHVLVLEADELTFGLLVREVTGVQEVAEDEIAPPPPGQDGTAVAGVLSGSDEVVLLLDARALRRRLSS